MEKFAAPIVAITSIFLYFTHDAGFQFERAEADKRAAFVERQAQKAIAGPGLQMFPGAGSVWVSDDQLSARLRLLSDGAIQSGRHRTELYRAACDSYLESYLDEHGIVLRLEFYRADGPMTGTISLSPRGCALAAPKAS